MDAIRLKFKLPDIETEQLEFINEMILISVLVFCLQGIALPKAIDVAFGAILFYPAVLFLCVQRWKKILFILTSDLSFLILLSVGLASVTWTVWPTVSFSYARGFVATILLAAYICATYSPKEQMKIWGRVLFIWGITTLLVSIIVPNYSLMVTGSQKVRWQGIFVFKFPLGLSMSFATLLSIFALIENRGKKIFLWICLIGSFTLVVLSDSKTSLSALMLSLTLVPLFLFGKFKSYQVRLFYYLIVFLLVVGSITWVTTNIETIIVDWLGKDLTLTGRIPLWKLMIDQGLNRPWLGHGPAGAFWQTEGAIDIAFNKGWPPLPATGTYLTGMHAHNGMVDLFLAFGFVGIFTFFLNYIIVIKRVLHLYILGRGAEFFWMILVLLIVTVTNFSEVGSILATRELRWLLYSTIVFSSAIQIKLLQHNSRQDHPMDRS